MLFANIFITIYIVVESIWKTKEDIMPTNTVEFFTEEEKRRYAQPLGRHTPPDIQRKIARISPLIRGCGGFMSEEEIDACLALIEKDRQEFLTGIKQS